jgi:hypothetical protein
MMELHTELARKVLSEKMSMDIGDLWPCDLETQSTNHFVYWSKEWDTHSGPNYGVWTAELEPIVSDGEVVGYIVISVERAE